MNIGVPASFAPAWQHADVHVISFITPLDACLSESSPIIFRPWKLIESHLISSLIQASNLDEAIWIWLKQP
jgi:hypothetical protein